jgi:hypothetical protein
VENGGDVEAKEREELQNNDCGNSQKRLSSNRVSFRCAGPEQLPMSSMTPGRNIQSLQGKTDFRGEKFERQRSNEETRKSVRGICILYMLHKEAKRTP